MKNEVTTNNDYTESLFESIKHINDFGQEFWYARELQEALEYKRWDKKLSLNIHKFIFSWNPIHKRMDLVKTKYL